MQEDPSDDSGNERETQPVRKKVRIAVSLEDRRLARAGIRIRPDGSDVPLKISGPHRPLQRRIEVK
jgi:hypothetical protein